jgi:hypothetical protein
VVQVGLHSPSTAYAQQRGNNPQHGGQLQILAQEGPFVRSQRFQQADAVPISGKPVAHRCGHREGAGHEQEDGAQQYHIAIAYLGVTNGLGRAGRCERPGGRVATGDLRQAILNRLHLPHVQTCGQLLQVNGLLLLILGRRDEQGDLTRCSGLMQHMGQVRQ